MYSKDATSMHTEDTIKEIGFTVVPFGQGNSCFLRKKTSTADGEV